ncbi:uncharacterized protein EV422DRAFT_571446 [Fimicolochytrium jonesii]|uniref:uncharacterized protein n=1 Tax=Fimicolochytrium jonesii TaxID=1396493 RepID=UPI0022FF34B9|nr:uncharacterized protein EV422DRAFT_571446 [Fimicolochytrium jonesii]KAI8816687.1 hypothetical protein EV422DRAFT_571446 [Fimicolochytrium jonesii]
MEWELVSEVKDLAAPADAIFQGDDIVTVTGGNTASRISQDGEVVWRAISKSGATYTKALDQKNALYIVGGKANAGGFVVSVLKVDKNSGQIEDEYQPPHGLISRLEDIHLVGDGELAYLLWNSAETAYRHLLGQPAEVEDLGKVFQLPTSKVTAVLHSDITHPEIALTNDEGLHIVRNPKTRLHSFQTQKGQKTLVASSQAVGVSYIASVAETGQQVNVDLVDVSALKPIGTFQIPFDAKAHGHIKKAFLDVFVKKDGTPAFSIFAVSEDGSTHVLKDGRVVWSKDESLTASAVAEYVDLPEKSLLSQEHDELDEQPEETASISPVQRYFRRLRTHLVKLQDYPAQLAEGLKGLDEKIWNLTNRTAGKSDELFADMLGVRKLVIFATEKGKLLAVNTESGNTVWQKFLPELKFRQLETVRGAVVKYPPVLAAIAESGKGDTVIYRFNALTGEAVDPASALERFPVSQKVIKLPAEEAEERTHIIALIGADKKIRVSPSTKPAQEAFERFLPEFRVYLTDGVGAATIDGYVAEISKSGEYSLAPAWKIQFPPGEKIAAIGNPPKVENIASVGRVLGDRSVLYKYLNPNLLALATLKQTGTNASDPSFSSATYFYLLDVVTGTTHYRSEHDGAGHVSTDVPSIHVAQVDNWAVLTYWNHGPEAATREAPSEAEAMDEQAQETKPKIRRRKKKAGTQQKQEDIGVPNVKTYEIVVFELFESAKPDQRIESDVFSSFQAKRPHVISQSYAFARRINAIGSTITKAGITTKELLFGLDEGHLYGVNKRWLDPRRPVGAPTADEKEEMLYPYRPVLDFFSRDVANYDLHVPGISNVLAAATKMESTSLAIAWGLDIFCVRRNPSKTFDVISEDFNYSALLMTITACLAGISVVKRMAQGKKITALWR